MVPARLLRRRNAAWLEPERGMPDRLHRAILGRAFRRGAARAGDARDGFGRARADPPAGRAGAPVRPAVRQDAARSRLYQGLSAGHPREWRPIYPRRAMVGDGLRQARPGRQGGEPVRDAQSDQSRPHAGGRCIATRSSPMSSPPTSIPCRPMSGAAAGPGTPAPPPGCSAPGWKASWECGWRAIAFASIPAYPKRGLASNSLCGAVRRDMRFASKIRRESSEASSSPPWMAPKSQRNRRGFRLSMTAPRTGSSFEWDEWTVEHRASNADPHARQ